MTETEFSMAYWAERGHEAIKKSASWNWRRKLKAWYNDGLKHAKIKYDSEQLSLI